MFIIQCCIPLTASIMKINEYYSVVHDLLEAAVSNVSGEHHLLTAGGIQQQSCLLFIIQALL